MQPIKTILIVIILLVSWYLTSLIPWTSVSPQNMWFAKPYEVFQALVEICSTQSNHIFATLFRVFISVIIVIILGIVTGLLIGYYTVIYRSLKPIIDFWRSIPPIIVIPILLFLDSSQAKEYMRILLVCFGCLPILTTYIAEAVYNASKQRLLIFSSISHGFWFSLRNVLLYETLPNIFTGTRTVLSISIIIMIVSEMVISPAMGVGYQIISYQTSHQIQFVYAYAIVLGLIGFILNHFLRFWEIKIIKWN